MSNIDKRVVQMVFDNEDFEKNIAKSKKSLESMDDTLDNIEKSVSKKVVEKTISSSIEKTELKIQALKSVIDTVVSSITSSVIASLGKCQQMINQLTFDQIGKGFEKYEEKLTAVQTIMNATGDSIQYVEGEMAKLMWYTDETSYNFSDMANNIGKFTAVGIGLEEASSAMQGIANWAGLAGQNAQAASRAMYNISQAMSAGYMKQQDWASIQTASMDTQEFRKMAFNTAKELAQAGKYTELTVEWFNEHTANDFFSDLGKNKNFTTDVLMATLAKFSSYSDEIHRMTEEEGMTTIEAMDLIGEFTEDQVKNLENVKNQFGVDSKEMADAADQLGISVKTATNIANTGWESFDLGRRAFEASQMYKTFKDVIEATADAASSSWMRIYQQIFGNLEQAKEFWTELGDIFYNVFVTPVESIVSVLEEWNKWSGRDMLLGVSEESFSVFKELYGAISDVVTVIKQAFLEMNPFISKVEKSADGVEKFVLDVEKLGVVLAYYTNQLRIWIWQHRLNNEQLETLKKTAKGLAVILKGIGKVIYSIGRSALKIWAALLPSFSTVINVLQAADENAETVDNTFNKIANTIYRVASIVAAIIKGFKKSVMDGTVVEYLSALGDFLITYAATYIRKFVTNSETEANGFINVIKGIVTLIGNLASSLVNGLLIIFEPLTKSILSGLENFVNSGIGKSILTFISEFGKLLGNTFVLVTNLINGLVNLLNIVIENINLLFTTLGANEQQASAGAMATIIGILALVISFIMDTIKEGKAIERMSLMNEIFENLGKALNSFSNAVNAVTLKEIGKAVALVAVAMLLIASIPQEKLGTTLKMVGGILVTFMASLALISSLSAKKVGATGLVGLVKSFQQLAVGMLIMASVMLKLMKLKPEEMIAGIMAISTMLGILTVFIALLNKSIKPGKDIDTKTYQVQVNAIVDIMKASIMLAIMINVLRSAMTSIGKMDTGDFIKGLIGLAAIMAAMTFMMNKLANTVKSSISAYRFSKDILSLAGAMAIIGIAMNLVMVPLAIMSFIPTKEMANGITTMAFMVLYISILFNSLTKFSKNANANQAKTVASAAAVMLSLAVALNLMFIPIMILTTISMVNNDALESGIWAFTRLIMVILAFVGGLGLLSAIGTKKISGTETGLSNWTTMFETLGKDMLMLAGAITAFMVPLAIIGVLSTLGVDVQFALLNFGLFLGEILAFLALSGLVTRLLGVDDALVALALSLFAIAGSVAALAAAVYLLVKSFEMLSNEINLEQFKKNGKVIGDFLIDIILILALVAGLLFIFKKTSLPILNTTKSGGKTKSTTSVTISLGQEILALGTGLMLMSMALVALMIPLKMLAAFPETEFYLAAEKLKYILIALGAFIGFIMLTFGLMSKFGGNNSTGWTQTATSTDSGIASIFKRGRKKVSTKEATSFGANMKELGKALIMFAAAITLLVLPIKLIGMIPDNEYNKGLIAVSSILGLIILMVALFGAMYGKEWSTKKIVALTLMVAVICGAVIMMVTVIKQLAVFLQDENMRYMFDWAMRSVLMISAVIGLLTVVAGLFGKKIVSAIVQRAGSEWALFGLAILEISAGVAMIALAMNKLMSSTWSEDWAPKLVTMTVVIIAVYGLFWATYGLTGKNTGRKAMFIATAILETAAAILIIAGAISLLTAIPSAGTIGENIVKLAFLFAYVLEIFIGLGILAENTSVREVDNFIKIAASVVIVAAAMLVIAGAMAIISKSEVDILQMLGMAVIIAAILGMLSIAADVSNAGDLLLAAAAFAIVAGGIVLLAAALALLADSAQKSTNGWADLWEGVKILAVMAVIGVAVVAVLALIFKVSKVVCGVMVIAAIVLGIVALSFLAMAAAIWLVVQTLIDLGNHWDEVEKGLNNITDWLKEHKVVWGEILSELFSEILSGFGLTCTNMQDLAQIAAEGIGAVFVEGAKAIGNSWKQMFAESREAKNLALREGQEFNKYQQDSGLSDVIYNHSKKTKNGWVMDITADGLEEAMTNMIKNNPNASNLTYDEFQKLFTGRYTENGKFSQDGKMYQVFMDNEEAFKRAYYNAGGRLFVNGKWYDQFYRDYENYGDTESNNTGTFKINSEEYDKIKTVLDSDGNVVAFVADGKTIDVSNKGVLYGEGGIVTQANEAWLEAAEDVSTAAGMMGDGVQLLTDSAASTTDPNAAAAAKYGAKYGDVGKGSAYVNAELAKSMAPGQAEAGAAGAEIYGGSFIDTLWSFFANGGDAGKTLWTEFNNTWLGKAFGSAGEQLEEWGKDIDKDLKDHGIDLGKMKDDALDQLGGYFGFDTNSEEFKEFKKNASIDSIKTKAKSVLENVVVNGQDLPTALKNAGVSAEGLENNMIFKMISEATGAGDLFGGEETDWEKWMDGFKIEGVEDISKLVEDKVGGILGTEDGENSASNYAAGITSGLDTNLGNFDYNDILDKYKLNDFYDTGYDMGTDQALGQIDGYDDYMKNLDTSKYTTDLDKYNTSLSDYGKDSESNLIWRGYGQHGEELWAPSKEDMYNNLVKPIRDGFEWHGWDAEGATPWKAVETAADAMKDAAEQTALAEKTIITDSDNQRWMLDEAMGKMIAIDEKGNPIMKSDMEGKEELWTKDITVPDSKIQNGVWIWDEKNKQWILTINGSETPNAISMDKWVWDTKSQKWIAPDGNGGMLYTDTKAGINGTPTLTDEQYEKFLKKQSQQAQMDKEMYAKFYGDLDLGDSKIKEFKDKNGKLLYYGGQKYTVKNKETGETTTKQKKYAMRGRKLAGYDNAYALVDEKGNLIFNSRGERIVFSVDKTNGVKLLSESMTQAADQMNKAGQEVETAAKSQTTQNGLYAASSAVSNAEATKDTYSTATVRNGDTGLVQSKYNNDVVPQNQASQQTAQDATQSAKSAIDHLQEINDKMSELLPMVSMINTHVDGLDTGMYTLVSLVSDIGTKDSPVVLDSNKLVGALKGPLNAGLGSMTRFGGRQVAT